MKARGPTGSSPPSPAGIPTLLDLGPDSARARLTQFLRSDGQPTYRVGQILKWLYVNTPGSFEGMSNLPKKLREALADEFRLHPLELHPLKHGPAAISMDGTRKFLWNRVDEPRGRATNVESVLIPDGDRTTYCISTQAGCPVKCTFCATGYGGFHDQLSGAEIVDQVLLMRNLTGIPPTNLVYMGMGEPLLNFAAVLRSLEILTHPDQVGMGAR